MDKESVIVTKKYGLHIALNIGVGGPAVELVVLSTSPRSAGMPIFDRGLDVDEGVALAVQILRAFDPTKLAEHTPLDLDAIFQSPRAQESMRKANEAMQNLPYDEKLEADADTDGAPYASPEAATDAAIEYFRPTAEFDDSEALAAAYGAVETGIGIIAVEWQSKSAQLSNGIVVPVVSLLDINGDETDSFDKAVGFVAGNDEQGYRTDFVASYVDLEETLGELTGAITKLLRSMLRLGFVETSELYEDLYGFKAGLGLLMKYNPTQATEVTAHLLEVIGVRRGTRPEDLEVAFEEHEREADKDVTGVKAERVTYGFCGRGVHRNFVEDVAAGPVRNKPSSNFGTLGGERGPAGRFPRSNQPQVDVYAEAAQKCGFVGSDVAGPQPDKIVTINEEAHGHE